MKLLTKNESYRTAFEYMNPSGVNSPFWYSIEVLDDEFEEKYVKYVDTFHKRRQEFYDLGLSNELAKYLLDCPCRDELEEFLKKISGE